MPFLALVALLLALHAPRGHAHSDEYFDARPTAHGGRMRMAGPLHLELVISDGRVRVYVTDHLDQPQASSGGTAVLRLPARDLRLTLDAGDANQFSAAAPPDVKGDEEAVLFVKLPGMDTQSAHYKARAAPAAPGAEAEHAHHH